MFWLFSNSLIQVLYFAQLPKNVIMNIKVAWKGRRNECMLFSKKLVYKKVEIVLGCLKPKRQECSAVDFKTVGQLIHILKFQFSCNAIISFA